MMNFQKEIWGDEEPGLIPPLYRKTNQAKIRYNLIFGDPVSIAIRDKAINQWYMAMPKFVEMVHKITFELHDRVDKDCQYGLTYIKFRLKQISIINDIIEWRVRCINFKSCSEANSEKCLRSFKTNMDGNILEDK